MPPRKRAKSITPVDAIRHPDRRANIPTSELRGFVADDETAPKTVLYPRDASLDPQLVWKGKDEQDRADLAVPVVPIYIQEKINPRAIVEQVRADAAQQIGAEVPVQLSLFADFDELPFNELVEFYEHDQNWANRLILGDSLLVMASLAEKENLKGRVQMIYFDPPYGIKFGSNWQVSTRKRDVKDGKAEDMSIQPEQIKAFRDTWQLGVHSYLSYLRDRLAAARDLLTASGSLFVQIGDENVHLVRNVLDEVFGSENFVSIITIKKTSSASGELLSGVSDYLLWYAKQRDAVKYRQLYFDKEIGGAGSGQYTWIEDIEGFRRRATKDEIITPPANSRFFRADQLTSQRPVQGEDLRSFEFNSRVFTPGKGTFKTDLRGLNVLNRANRLLAIGNTLTYVRHLNDFPAFPINNLWEDTVTSGFSDPKIYVVQTNPIIIQRCMLMTTDPGDLVLDPTCGSGTTAYVAEQWGRRWITIDTSRVALALARTRLMAARYPFYLLADSADGVQKEADITGKLPPTYETKGDIKRGFVYRRVPHITLKSIANNPEIDTIHDRWQPRLDALREAINVGVGQGWEEWEIPREIGAGWSDRVQRVHAEYWQARRERQAEIDTAIARYADLETLYDQPYEDNKRVRVAGPFTVESLSPHRVLNADEELPASLADGQRASSGEGFVPAILANLKAAGVQNTRKGERLVFDRLEPYAGARLHAAGEYTDADGQTRRAAVSIGPEYGTVGPQQVREAAREAVTGLGFDVLVICGFAFDPHVSEEVKQYGRLTVLPAHINPDLRMGAELLKKTGTGNLFMVFGEPDIDIRDGGDGRLEVEIRGLDIYDPTTGEIRSSSTDDIACWLLDTAYNGESFFVRHAYFTGADKPYEKLQKALRAEINEDAWAQLYSTISYPFDRPATGKIAIKVINHYGDEVLKVYGV